MKFELFGVDAIGGTDGDVGELAGSVVGSKVHYGSSSVRRTLCFSWSWRVLSVLLRKTG